ncbi:hypothetical protein ACFV1H_18730 [Streptomyces virginiae]|uniref:hypothetical protein n=1 Tax=Streptomyces virginiae TaxID=1961 RepID=UPI0036C2B0A9
MTARLPYEHTLAEINDISQACNSITGGRSVPGDVAVGILTTRSNLAIAAALLAVAVAIRNTQPGSSR